MKFLGTLSLLLLAIAVVAEEPIPPFFDACEQWKECVGEIRDQGKCTSTWAHAIASMVGDRHCISKKTNRLDLSAQSLISCSATSKNCQGNFDLNEVQDLMVKKGLLTDSCFRYQASDTIDCPTKCSNEEEIHWYKCSLVEFLSDVDAIKREVMTNGPVVCIGNLYGDFKDYYSGVYYQLYV